MSNFFDLSDRLKRFERYSTELIKILNSVNAGNDLAQDPLVDNLPRNRYLLPEEIIPINNGLFRLACWNCCGVLSSLDFLSTFLPRNGIGVMRLWESFLNASTLNAADIQGYQILQKNRLNNQKGGLAFYIHTSLHFEEIEDFDSLYEEMLFEFLVIEVTIASEKVLLCMFYRPPSFSTKKYLDNFKKFAKMVSSKKRKIIIMGDFDIDTSSISHKLKYFCAFEYSDYRLPYYIIGCWLCSILLDFNSGYKWKCVYYW